MAGSQKVVCWNSAGMRASANSTALKFAFFEKEFPNANFAIAAFIETHHKDAGDYAHEFKEFEVTHNVIHTPVKNESHSGIIVFINKEYEIKSHVEVIPGRLLNVKISRNRKQQNLTFFYGPQWSKMKKEEILKTIDHFDGLHHINDRNLIIGDFNFIDNDLDKGKNMDSKDKMIYPRWEQFKSEKAIIDPFRTQYPKKKIYSYVATTGKSRGDRLYISEGDVNTVTNMKYINTPFNAAHKIMTFDLKDQQEIGPSYWKMNSSVLKDHLYKSEIENAIKGINDLQLSNPIDWWDLFIMVVQGVTISYTKRKSKIENGLKRVIINKIYRLEKINSVNMTAQQKKDQAYYQQRYKEIVEHEIQGHQIRTRGLPTYEINEPDIHFYSKLEKRFQQKNLIIIIIRSGYY